MGNKVRKTSTRSLQPYNVTDITTGEVLSIEEYEAHTTKFLELIKELTTGLYEKHRDYLLKELVTYTGLPQPAEWARQHGINIDYALLPPRTKIISRVNKLVQHNLILNTRSYVNNHKTRNKQEPAYPAKASFGATDKLIITMSQDPENPTHRSVQAKILDKELLLEFHIPEFMANRKIIAYSLPTLTKKGWQFSQEELVPEQSANPTLIAGVDLGRLNIFHSVVLNQKGNLVAEYKTSKELNRINRKRENLLKQNKFLYKREQALYKLAESQPDPITKENLLKKRERVYEARQYNRNKAKRISESLTPQASAELTRKLAQHSLNLVACENLAWVTGARYGSKWAHSQTQAKLEHSLLGSGVSMSKVPAKDTSKRCYKCGTILIQNSKKRTARCITCEEVWDHDFVGAMNIALSKKRELDKLRTQALEKLNKKTPSLRLGSSDHSDQGSLIEPLQVTTMNHMASIIRNKTQSFTT